MLPVLITISAGRSLTNDLERDSSGYALLSTAAGVVAVIELFARGLLPPGFVKQESIGLDQFFDTQWGGRVYREAETIAPRISVQA